MTQYHGGKHRHGKKIAEVINPMLAGHSGYCEPFHGMLGVYRHISDTPNLTYLAGDLNKSVNLMWIEAQKGWVPPNRIVSKEEFLRLKFDGTSTPEKGFIGCSHAYNGLYFRCYCMTENMRNAIPGAAKRVSDIALNTVVKKVKFSYGEYKQFSDLRNFVIYCDPPYEGTIGYRNDESKGSNPYDHFDNSEFWKWASEMAKYNTVIVSEFSEPKCVDFEVLLDFKNRDIKQNLNLEKVYCLK